MRKLIVLFLIGFWACFAQEKTIIELDDLSSPASGDYIPIWDASAQTTKRLSLSNLDASNLIGTTFSVSDDHTWTGANNFSQSIQIPTSISSSLANSVGYNSGLFSWIESGSIKTAADRAWVLQQIADSGVAVDTNSFAKLDANNSFTGNNTFTGTDVFSALKVASASNSGNLKIPYYLSGAPSGIDGAFYYDATNNKLKIYESGWRSFPDSAGIMSMVQTGSYLQTSGTQTGLSSTLTWSSGTLYPYLVNFGAVEGDAKSLILPLEDIGSVAKNTSTGSIFYDKAGDALYVRDTGAWEKFYDDDAVDNLLSAKLAKADLDDSLKAQTEFFSATLPYPTSSENVVLFRAPFAIEIDSVHAVLSGSASCSTKVNIQWGDTRTTADSELFYGDQWVSSTTGTNMTGDTYAFLINKGDWVWFKTSGLVGTVYDINLTITYTRY